MSTKRLFFALSGALLFVFLFTNCNQTTDPEDPIDDPATGYVCDAARFTNNRFPVTKDYPLTADSLHNLVYGPRGHGEPGHTIRAHGYRLFAGLMEEVPGYYGNTVWRWQTWFTATQALEQTPGAALAERHEASASTNLLEANLKNGDLSGPSDSIINYPPPHYKVPDTACVLAGGTPGCDCDVPIDGCIFQNNGDVMIAGVVYNEPAYQHIRDKELYSWNSIYSKWKSARISPTARGEIEQFPHKSFVLKPMLWPVKQTGYTALPVWRDQPNVKAYSGFEVESIWPNGVAVTPDPVLAPDTTTVTFLHDVYTASNCSSQVGPITFASAPVHNIEDFYYWQVTQEDMDHMSDIDLAILHQSAIWCYNRPFQAGDYLVLIAMHIMTKEQPEWTFQSVWWSDDLNSRYHKSNDSVANPPKPNAFKNYLMMTTYGQTSNQMPGEYSAQYNPYIELAAAHPITTNCRNCHQRGSFPNQSQLASIKAHDSKVTQNRYAFYQLPGAGLPGPLDTFAFSNTIYDSLLIMDYQWTLTDRLKYSD